MTPSPARTAKPGKTDIGDSIRYETEIDLSLQNNSHTQQILLIGRNKRVLEIGPATGYVTKVLRERGCSVIGVEVDPVAAAKAAEFSERVVVDDVERIDVDAVFYGETFDVILFGDVLEHLVEPAAVLSKLSGLLQPQGHIVASIPNISHGSIRLALLSGKFQYQDVGLLDRTHLRFFTRHTLQDLFAASGYAIEDWRPILLDPFGTELGLREADFPAYLVQAIRADPHASEYQFVVRASKREQGPPGAKKEILRPGADSPTIAELSGVEARLVEIQQLFETADQASRARDRSIEQLQQELARATAGLVQSDQFNAAKVKELAEVTDKVRNLEEALAEKNVVLNDVSEIMERFHNAAGYRAVEAYWRLLDRLAPAGSARARLYQAVARPLRRLAGRSPRKTESDALPPEVEAPEPEAHPETSEAYATWIQENEPSEQELADQCIRARSMPFTPLISIVIPAWKPDLNRLHETVASVQAQTYPRWEVCLAAGEASPELVAMLGSLSSGDSRVKFVLLPENRGIAGNTNAALEMAEGEFVGFLDQTDLLARSALFEICVELNRQPGLDCLYSDWDLLSADGSCRFNPFFSPEWAPEMLLSSNYMAHFSVVRKRLVEAVGGLRPELDGAQDWDLILRVTELTSNVRRLSQVLYHWRADETSAALSLTHKPYASAAQMRAINDHLQRKGWPATVEYAINDQFRVKWREEPTARVSIMIPTKNRSFLARCLNGIAQSDYRNYEVIVVDTGGRSQEADDWYAKRAKGLNLTVLWWEGEFNYSCVNNYAASRATGDLLLFLNDDTVPNAGNWLAEMAGWAEREEIGAVGAQLLDESGDFQHAGVIVGMSGFAEHLFRGLKPGDWTLIGSTDWYRNFLAVTGACLMVSRKTFDEVGGWNEAFQLCGGDVDLCLRIRDTGRRNVCTPYARLEHFEGSTRGRHVPADDYFASFWAYQKYVKGEDPYFNPNLSRFSTTPRLRPSADPHPISVVSKVIGRELGPGGPPDQRAEASALAGLCNVSSVDIERTRALHTANSGFLQPKTINWLIPDFESPFYGGINTIFRFADHFASKFDVENRFLVVGTGPEEYLRAGMRLAFPGLEKSEIVLCPSLIQGDQTDALPSADASIATFWLTAHALTRMGGTQRKFYFIQDYEPMFYAAGTTFALAEDSYRMGLYGICNTEPLKTIYEREYGGKAVSFIPSVDTRIFHPAEEKRESNGRYKVFVYARPGHPRNCYELAVAALRQLKARLKDKVEIVTAGSWETLNIDGDGNFMNHLGLLSYEETAELYRNCDVGLILSVSKHPSYLPLELMASGCLVVSNFNSSTGWLLRHEENCLLSTPSADALHASLERALVDEPLRERLVGSAVSDVRDHYSSWKPEMEKVFTFLSDPEAAGANSSNDTPRSPSAPQPSR